MLRWLSLLLFRRAFVFFLVAVLACSAQSSPSDLDRRIERQVRSHFNIPATVSITIGPRTPSSEFPNYENVVITFAQGERKQTQEFLVAKDGTSLLRLTKLDLHKDPYAEIMKKINLDGRPTRGAKDAKVTIINYDDFQCPFCARMYSTLVDDVLKSYGDRVKLVMKDFPLSEIHPWATRAAVNANCLAQQSGDAYWAFSDYVHANQKEISAAGKSTETSGSTGSAAVSKPALADQQAHLDRLALEFGQKHSVPLVALQSCIKAQSEAAVQASVKEGTELGVQATPTLFVNGEKLDGAVPAAQLRAVIDRALRDAGEPMPQPAGAKASPGGQ